MLITDSVFLSQKVAPRGWTKEINPLTQTPIFTNSRTRERVRAHSPVPGLCACGSNIMWSTCDCWGEYYCVCSVVVWVGLCVTPLVLVFHFSGAWLATNPAYSTSTTRLSHR